MLGCRVFGHRYRFSADGPTMRWSCSRGCGAGGEKAYATAAEAQRFAQAFDKPDSASVGDHPTLSTLPLWLARKLGRRDRFL
jgi:hypothetical protein